MNFERYLEKQAHEFIWFALHSNIIHFLMIYPALLIALHCLSFIINRFKIQDQAPKFKVYLREFCLCLSSFVMFSFSVATFILLAKHGYYQLYSPWNQLGVAYFILSIIILIAGHETYHYWLHRLMHSHPGLYRHVHRVHHLSVNPTVFSTYSFHPIEALLHPLAFVVMPLFIPLNMNAIALTLVIGEVVDLLGHHGYEWCPAWMSKAPLLRHLNRATFHNLHHSQGGRKNFSYYTTIWDKLMGTHHPDSDKAFAAVLARRHTHTQAGSQQGH